MKDTIASVVRLILALSGLAVMHFGWLSQWRGFWQGFGGGMEVVVMVWFVCSKLPVDNKPKQEGT